MISSLSLPALLKYATALLDHHDAQHAAASRTRVRLEQGIGESDDAFAARVAAADADDVIAVAYPGGPPAPAAVPLLPPRGGYAPSPGPRFPAPPFPAAETDDPPQAAAAHKPAPAVQSRVGEYISRVHRHEQIERRYFRRGRDE